MLISLEFKVPVGKLNILPYLPHLMPRPRITAKHDLLTPSQARRLYAYNQRLFERFVRSVRKLSWEDASRKREIGHQSLFGTLVHILNVHEVWMDYIIRGRNSDPELEKLFGDKRRRPADWKGFTLYNRRVWKAINEQLGKLTARDMGKRVSVFWMPGNYVLSDAIMQTTFEQAHHLGEIIGAMWQQDTEPPRMTWISVGDAMVKK